MEKLNMNVPDLKFQPTSPDEITKLAKSIKKKFTTDYYNISTSVALKTIDNISTILTHLINKTIETGIFPDRLKIAKLTPIYKKEEKHLFNNYRPISILPIFSKLYEKVIYTRLLNHFDTHQILTPNQFGFRQNHSTDHAIISIIDTLTEKLDSHYFTTGIFLDLSKAFDTINHEILLSKLKYYGIRGTELELIKNYLTNRQQCTQYNETTCISDLLQITHGIPQGSILGPLLFIIYINDITTISNTISTILFADDTNILSFDYDQMELLFNLNSDLNIIDDWLKANKLSLNIKKTEDIIFTTPQRKRFICEQLKNNITIQDKNITQVSQTNFLGTRHHF